MKKCPKCGLYHYSKKDRRGNWILVKVVKPDLQDNETTEAETPLSKNVFIVHGKERQPVKDLKVMLYDFGLNPIILHEKPSGSRTIIEKLEKYSEDIGYTFVIPTPDDFGGSVPNKLKTEEALRTYDLETEILNYAIRRLSEAHAKEKISKEEHDRLVQRYQERKERVMHRRIDLMHPPSSRARQNVILEFGYFMGLLGRNRVCCLHKGDVELPSDMHGIVYIPFSESVEEVRYKIIKELKAADYELKI